MLIDILPIVRAGPVSVTFLFEIRPLLGNADTIYRLLAAAETPSSLAGSERVERLVRGVRRIASAPHQRPLLLDVSGRADSRRRAPTNQAK
jgi:hypothetical protein